VISVSNVTLAGNEYKSAQSLSKTRFLNQHRTTNPREVGNPWYCFAPAIYHRAIYVKLTTFCVPVIVTATPIEIALYSHCLDFGVILLDGTQAFNHPIHLNFDFVCL